jgi:hypothetical protein
LFERCVMNHLRLPVIYMPMLYTLRAHVNMAQQRLEKLPVANGDRALPAVKRVEKAEK